MKRKSSGVAVVAILIGVAVFATLYIAGIGKSRTADSGAAPLSTLAVQQGSASEAVFGAAPVQAASNTEAGDRTAAR